MCQRGSKFIKHIVICSLHTLYNLECEILSDSWKYVSKCSKSLQRVGILIFLFGNRQERETYWKRR